jgi:hypothetical protein
MSTAGPVCERLCALVEALANAALLLDACGNNHARAEAAAAPYGLPAYALPQRPICTVIGGVPPIYGGNSDEPFGWGMILGFLAGHTWPGADLDRLEALASAWRNASAGLDTMAAWPARAAAALDAMRSPELPAAITASHRLSAIAHSLAADCADVARAVTAFTTEVAHHRDPVRDIVLDLAATVGCPKSVAAR